MITPDWLSNELNILQAHKELQESILRDITRRIIKTDFTVTDTAAWQAEKLQQSGMLYKDILKEISKETGKSQAEINRAFKDAHTEVFKYDESELEAAGEDAKEFRHMSPQMKAVMTAALKKASKEIKNLTGTTAVTSQSAFIRACDLAHMQIVSGAFTYQDAIKTAIKSAAKEGVTIVYPSGHVSSLDAAVRRAVLSGVNQTTGTLVKMRAEETGHDLMQLSAHSGAREDHADWQGKIVSLSGKKGYLSLDDIGYGEVTGFMGANCRHTWFIFYEGISKPAYTNEQLESFKNETVTYEGEVIPLRQALDRQRAMERSIRRSKQELVMFDEASKNVTLPEEKLLWKQEFENASVKLKAKEAKLKDFCDKTGLKRDRYREQVFATQTENGIKNFGKSASQKAVQNARKRYNDFVSVVGKEYAPATLDKYYELKYNDKKAFDELKRFYKFRLDNPVSTKEHFYCAEEIKKLVKCQKIYLPAIKEIDIDSLTFNDFHANIERGHKVSEKDAKSFIRNSVLTLERYNGNSWIFVSKSGASYVLRDKNLIRTAFFQDEYKGKMPDVIKELKKYGFI